MKSPGENHSTRTGIIMLSVIATVMIGNLLYIRSSSLTVAIPIRTFDIIRLVWMTLHGLLFLFSLKLILLKRSRDYIYLMLIASAPAMWLLFRYITINHSLFPSYNVAVLPFWGLEMLVSSMMLCLVSLSAGEEQSRNRMIVDFILIPLIFVIGIIVLILIASFVLLPHFKIIHLNKWMHTLSGLISLIAMFNYVRRYQRTAHLIYWWFSMAALCFCLSIIFIQLSNIEKDLYDLFSLVNRTLFIFALVWATFEEHTRFLDADIQLRRKLEASLFNATQNLDTYLSLLNNLDVGIFTTDEDGFITFANSAFSELSGVAQERLKGRNIREFFEKGYLDSFPIKHGELAPEFNEGINIKLKRREGRYIPVYIKASTARNKFKKSWGNQFIVHDRSERDDYDEEMKAYTQELKQAFDLKTKELANRNLEYEAQQNYFQSLISSIRDILLVVDLEGNCTYINDYGQKILGYTTKDLTSKKLPAFLADMEQMHRKFRSSFNFVISNHEAVITTKQRVDLLCSWDVHPLIDQSNTMAGIICLGRDISEQRRLEHELADHEGNLSKLVEQRTKELEQNISHLEEILKVDREVIMTADLPDMLSSLAQSIQKSGWNKVAITLTPDLKLVCFKGIQKRNLSQFISKHEVVLKHTHEFLNERNQVGKAYHVSGSSTKDLADTNRVTALEVQHAQHHWREGDALIIPIRFKSKLLGFIIVFDPVKPIQLDEGSVRVLELFAHKAAIVIENVELYDTLKTRTIELESLNKTKTDFFANIAHELRTPLTAILSLSSALLKRMAGELNQEQLHQIQIIQRNGEQLLRLINENLSLVKMEAGKMEVNFTYFQLKNKLSAIIETVKPLCDRKKLNFDVSIARDVPDFIFSDEDKITHVLLNLLSNAVKFCDRGKITFRTSYYKATHILQFIIKDTGIGMDRQEIDKIFQPYSQTDQDAKRKQTGTGLGLSIAKTYWEMINGEIKVESKKGRGTIFTLSLPVREEYTEILTEVSPVSTKADKKITSMKKILLVDDNVDNQYALKFILNDIGYQLISASNGEEGVKKAIREKPALILMDMMMPGMDGYEATRKIKSNRELKKIPVIAMTAKTRQEDRDKALKAGCSDYLSKPFSSDQIVRKVSEWIGN